MTDIKAPWAESPSLDLIYPLAMESYETARQRMITQDNRIHQILTLMLAVTAAIPAVYQIFGINPRPAPLAAAGVFFILGIGCLISAMMRNRLFAVTVSTLHTHYIDLPITAAKEALIKYAGEHDEKNARYMGVRNSLILCSVFCLALEVLSLALSGASG